MKARLWWTCRQARSDILKKTVGKGFSARPQWVLGQIETDADRRAVDEYRDLLKSRDGTLRERAKRFAAALNGGTAPPPGSMGPEALDVIDRQEVWYAHKISDLADDLEARRVTANHFNGSNISKDELQGLLFCAYSLGRLVREAELKFDWEPDAMRGRSQAEALRSRSNLRNQAAQAKAAARRAEWQEMARAIWERNPALSKAAVANIIADKTGVPANTIRQVIKKS